MNFQELKAEMIENCDSMAMLKSEVVEHTIERCEEIVKNAIDKWQKQLEYQKYPVLDTDFEELKQELFGDVK